MPEPAELDTSAEQLLDEAHDLMAAVVKELRPDIDSFRAFQLELPEGVMSELEEVKVQYRSSSEVGVFPRLTFVYQGRDGNETMFEAGVDDTDPSDPQTYVSASQNRYVDNEKTGAPGMVRLYAKVTAGEGEKIERSGIKEPRETGLVINWANEEQITPNSEDYPTAQATALAVGFRDAVSEVFGDSISKNPETSPGQASVADVAADFGEIMRGSFGRPIINGDLSRSAGDVWDIQPQLLNGERAGIEIPLPDQPGREYIDSPRLQLIEANGGLVEAAMIAEVPIEGSDPIIVEMRSKLDHTQTGADGKPLIVSGVRFQGGAVDAIAGLISEEEQLAVLAELHEALAIMYDKERFAYDFETMTGEQAEKIIHRAAEDYMSGDVDFPERKNSYGLKRRWVLDDPGRSHYGSDHPNAQKVLEYQLITKGGLWVEVAIMEDGHYASDSRKGTDPLDRRLSVRASQSSDTDISPEIRIGLGRTNEGEIELTVNRTELSETSGPSGRKITFETENETAQRELHAKRAIARILYEAFYIPPKDLQDRVAA
ncbi:hypothetical protein KA529_03990 [Candidatus Saccharibacteria bacterium]|nr:hypothetical protein [Candidatus Saccharibacteria bacterium]